jgi:hypothetical protein
MEDINTYLSENSEFNVESLIKFIYGKMPKKLNHERVHFKKYTEDNLVQLFTETARDHSKWAIYNICRSIIFDNQNNKVVSYSHPNIEYLEYNEAISRMNDTILYTESHEGTLISMFYNNNKWYYATRRHIDMYKTNQIIQGVKSELSHGQMFEDALSKINLTKDSFESMLNTNYKYNFELVHYQNKFNISYESRFGDKYAKIFLLFVRDENQELINNCDETLSGFKNEYVDNKSVNVNLLDNNLVMEGYIFNSNNNLCKVMHPNYYNIMKYNPGYKTKQEQYIYLYQKNLLVEYLDKINNKVYKQLESGESIEVVGLVSCVFAYIGQRMLDIYYTFNNNSMVHRNEDKYKELFISKKYYFIFHTLGMMKGIHKNKQLNINEMRTYLKYKITANDMWKLFHEIIIFEDTENILTKWSNIHVRVFI